MAVTRRVRLLTLVGPGGRRDVVAAAEAPLLFLFPVIVELVGDGQTPADSPRWGLYDVQGQVLRRTSTLLGEQVVDGAVLTLSATPPGGPPPVPHPDVRTAVLPDVRSGPGADVRADVPRDVSPDVVVDVRAEPPPDVRPAAAGGPA